MAATLTVAVALGGMLAAPSGALTTSGKPIALGAPGTVGSVAAAVDSSGTAYVAWSSTSNLIHGGSFVQYCVLPAGGSGCVRTGELVPEGALTTIEKVSALVEGSSVVVLADGYGSGANESYEPLQEWQSDDGGAAFTPVGPGGKSVAAASVGQSEPSGATTVGGGQLGYGWVSASHSPTFKSFPLDSPPECSLAHCASGFATLEPSSDGDQISNVAGAGYAGQGGGAMGVLGIFPTAFASGPLGCAGTYGDAYVYGSGEQSASNSYDVSPGSAGSAWRVAVSQADCGVQSPAVAGGPAGLGVLEDEVGANEVVYHAFDQGTATFDTPLAMVDSGEGETDPTLSQDGAGGIYATYLGGGKGGPIKLAYSDTAGKSWIGPETIVQDADQGAEEVTSAVGTGGQGWLAWVDGGSVYAQQFAAADALPEGAVSTVTTSQSSGRTKGVDISIHAGTVGESDSAKIAGTDAATASGTMSYTLYSSPTCKSASAVFHSAPEPVSGGVAVGSAPVASALAPGRYYWVASYSGNPSTIAGGGGNLPSTSGCGSEVLSVLAPTTIGPEATSTGMSVTIAIACTVVPCAFELTITATVPAGHGGGSHHGPGTKTLTLATGRFTLRRHGTRRLTLRLSGTGRSYLAGRARASVKVLASERIGGRSVQASRVVKLRRRG